MYGAFDHVLVFSAGAAERFTANDAVTKVYCQYLISVELI